MDEKQVKVLLQETFENKFDQDRFTSFVKELFNEFELRDCDYGKEQIPKEFSEFISSYKCIGSFEDCEGRRLDVLSVKLEKSSSRDLARTKQRNFIARYLMDRNVNSALVAFYGEEIKDWRLSFVKVEYHLEETDKGIKPTEFLTPPKRFLFLVGETEPSHTAQSRFIEFLIKEDTNPKVSEIEEAFSVEKVTKEFFEKYKGLYDKLEKAISKTIKNDKVLNKEFKEKGISTEDFAKKLLGQIVFLYFLQKKGWLGVPENREWGEGDKRFLRNLFEKCISENNNFFSDYLQKLFYNTLNNPRSNQTDPTYSKDFKCKIPFLNGGLFEPIGGYDWENSKLKLDNKIFNKILEIFDLYNFTVKEDEPLEKEVAIDPEMLGKVFENLLEIKDRKSKGSYYTPREIVHYMCQESLINYLETETGLNKKDIESFIHNEEATESIKKNHEKIDKFLKEIKVVDPAIGSGAFPVGMMMEIIKARSVLTQFLPKKEQTERTAYNMKRECIEDSLYGVDIDPGAVDIAQLRLWLSLIVDEIDIHKVKPLPNLDYKIMCGNSLLDEFEGVKLFDERLLGEFVKDNSFEIKQVEDRIKNLYQEFGEIQTGKKKDNGRSKEIKKEIKKLEKRKQELLLGPKKEVNHGNLDGTDKVIKESQKKLKELRKLQKEFLNEYNKRKKIEKRKDIEKLIWDLIDLTLKEEGNEEARKKLETIKRQRSRPFFLWKLYFSEVFQRDNPGFDVVIANPPYVGERGNKDIFREVKITNFGKRFYKRKMDYFYFFFHKSLDLVRGKGIVSFITTNYYITADGAIYLRTDFKNRTTIKNLVNFNELKIFDSAKGQHNMISILLKDVNMESFSNNCITKRIGTATEDTLKTILSLKDVETSYYKVKQIDLYDGDKNYIRISGNDTSIGESVYNPIIKKIKDNSIPLIEIKNVNQGVLTGVDKVTDKHIDKYRLSTEEKNKGIFVLSDEEIKSLKLEKNEKEIIKPYYKNSDIFKFHTHSIKNKRNVIYTTRDLDIKNFPNIKQHFWKYEKIIKSRSKGRGEMQAALKLGKWWVIFAARHGVDFEGPKIVCPQRSPTNTFGYNEEPWYGSADVYYITDKEQDNEIQLKYLLCLLNSKLFYVWLYFRGKRKGELLELFYQPLTEIPIKKITLEQQKPFIELVDKILNTTKDDDYLENPDKKAKVKDYEKEIDQLVYKLYGLTKEEIEIVEDRPNYTSQICSKCGELGSRSGCSFVCHCGFSLNADLNASLNLASPMLEKRQALITKPHIRTDEHESSIRAIECEVMDKYPAL